MLRLLFACVLLLPTAVTAAQAPPATAQAPPATAKPPPADAAKAREVLDRELLDYAFAMVGRGQQQQAIDQYLDPMLARFAALYAGEKRRIYVTRGLLDTMAYLTGAAGEKQDAIAVGPIWGEALYMKGFALVDLGKHAEARAVYGQALALSPFNAAVISEIGNLDQRARDWPAALATFERAIAATAYSPEADRSRERGRAMRGAGFALIELARLDEAEAMFRKCLALDPGDRNAAQELRYIADLRAAAGKPVPKT